MDGFLLIDKPEGITSHDVVDRLRRLTGIRRIGHAGTLDPFATGLLIVGVGRGATKRLSEIMGKEKTYDATAVLGATSVTQDRTGTITETESEKVRKWPEESAVREAMAGFVGPQKQVPPMFSAKKIAGKKLYELARAGLEVERKPADITIHALELLRYAPPILSFRVRCSSGTYVRTLAHDLGHALGTGAYLEALRRTAIGEYRVENAAELAALTPENWQKALFAL
ncbi:MAG TPA: tRNA pseudouridine(55) synthase TruB [Patescibacteria group bacterium]|nr:tRNA pseudouridine(55) synthase TruB [Patescibacteria group bacterium]